MGISQKNNRPVFIIKTFINIKYNSFQESQYCEKQNTTIDLWVIVVKPLGRITINLSQLDFSSIVGFSSS